MDKFNYSTQGKQKKEIEIAGIKRIQTYGVWILLVMLITYGSVFFGFKWLELNELQQDLTNLSRSILEEKNIKPFEETILPYPDDVIVIKKQTSDTKNGFYEINISNKDYLVYTESESDVIVAKPEQSINDELNKFLVLLMFLYFGQIVILLGWWFYFKGEIQKLFKVQ